MRGVVSGEDGRRRGAAALAGGDVPSPAGDTATLRVRLCGVLDVLRDRGTGRARRKLSGAGHERTDRPRPAGWSADGRVP